MAEAIQFLIIQVSNLAAFASFNSIRLVIIFLSIAIWVARASDLFEINDWYPFWVHSYSPGLPFLSHGPVNLSSISLLYLLHQLNEKLFPLLIHKVEHLTQVFGGLPLIYQIFCDNFSPILCIYHTSKCGRSQYTLSSEVSVHPEHIPLRF